MKNKSFFRKEGRKVIVLAAIMLVAMFVVIPSASVESTNHQASGVGIDLRGGGDIATLDYDSSDCLVMNINKFKYKRSIEQGISYLFSTRTDRNRKRGEFAFFESTNKDMSGAVYRQINFGTPFVYHSLGFVENLRLKPSSKFKIKIMKRNAITFMKRHKEIDNYDNPNVLGVDTGGAVWRYYYGSRFHGQPSFVRDDKSERWRTRYVGPDIDDTVMKLQALYENGEDIDDYYPTTAADYFIKYQLSDAFINKSSLTPPVQLQYDTFNTWIHQKRTRFWEDFEAYDATVNANVLFFYSTQLTTSELQNQIPEVFDYINYASDKMNENRQDATFPGIELHSIVYPSPFTFTYFVSRAYKDGGAPITGTPSIDIDKISEYILADDDNDGQPDRQKTDGSWGNFEMIDGTKTLVTNDLETALATLSLLNIYDTLNESDKVTAKTAIDKSIEYLLENQNPDGSWDIAFWFIGVPPTMFTGSAELTTGFVLEALAKYPAIR